MAHLKTTMIYASIFAALLCGASCDNSNKPADTKDVAQEHNEAKFDNTSKEKDAQFLVNAAEINLQEIKLGQLAQERGQTTGVKELGTMMVDAHTKVMSELTDLAKKKLVTIPSAPTEKVEDAYKKLSAIAGNKFDKEYCSITSDDHKEALSIFEKESTEANDIEIKNWAATILPVVRMHIDHIITCQKNLR